MVFLSKLLGGLTEVINVGYLAYCKSLINTTYFNLETD